MYWRGTRNEGRARSLTQVSYSLSSSCAAIHRCAVVRSMPSGMAKMSLSPSPLGVMCAMRMRSRTDGGAAGSVVAAVVSALSWSSCRFEFQYPSGSAMWSLSYMESPLGVASALTRRPFLNVACGVMMGSPALSCRLTVSKSSAESSPLRRLSSASMMRAQMSATAGLVMASRSSFVVHGTTVDDLMFFAIPIILGKTVSWFFR